MRIFKSYTPFIAWLLCLLLLPGFTWDKNSIENGGSKSILTPLPKISYTAGIKKSSNSKPKVATKTTVNKRKPITPVPHDHTKETVKLIAKANQSVHKTGQSSCVNCSLAPISGLESILRAANRSSRMARTCNALMDSNGHLGSTGRSIFSIMSEARYARYFTRDNSLGDFCPNFNNLEDSERLQAWTWFWTALAQEEASCVEDRRHGTIYRSKKDGRVRILNPREGYGLWALEKDRNIRRWRGSACSNISSAAGQARCTIDIMMKTQLAKGRTAGINKSSYWGPVRRGYKQLMPHMRRLKLCF